MDSRELNILVAEKVLGLKNTFLPYSTDISYAFQVLDFLVQKGWYYDLYTYGGGGILRKIQLTPDEDMLPLAIGVQADGETEAEAICLAAIKTVDYAIKPNSK
jgi:hypothetical protein